MKYLNYLSLYTIIIDTKVIIREGQKINKNQIVPLKSILMCNVKSQNYFISVNPIDLFASVMYQASDS